MAVKDQKHSRKNDLYARAVPSGRTIDEIKQLAALKNTTVGVIIHREHGFTRALREKATGGIVVDLQTVEDLLRKHGLQAETA
jgi:hypothetical protein